MPTKRNADSSQANEPLHRVHAVPTRNDESQRAAMLDGQRLAVHGPYEEPALAEGYLPRHDALERDLLPACDLFPVGPGGYDLARRRGEAGVSADIRKRSSRDDDGARCAIAPGDAWRLGGQRAPTVPRALERNAPLNDAARSQRAQVELERTGDRAANDESKGRKIEARNLEMAADEDARERRDALAEQRERCLCVQGAIGVHDEAAPSLVVGPEPSSRDHAHPDAIAIPYELPWTEAAALEKES